MKRSLVLIFLLLCSGLLHAQTKQEQMRVLAVSYNEAISKNDFTSALSVMNKFIELDSTWAPFYINRAAINKTIHEEDKEAIMADYNKAIELCPDSPSYYFLRGDFLWWQHGDKDKVELAVEDFKKVLSLDSTYYDAYEKLHTYYSNRDNNKEAAKIRKLARRNFQKLVDKDTTNAYSWYLLGKAYDLLDYIYEQKSIRDKCFEYYSKAIALDSTKWEYYWERGTENSFYKKDYRACIADFTKLLTLQQSHLYYIYIADSYDELGDREKALSVIDEALKLYPDHWQLLDTKKRILKKKKK